MASVRKARAGKNVEVKGRRLKFSLWPMRIGSPRLALQSHIFASNPWTVIRQVIRKRCSSRTCDAALAFLEQSHDYLRSASLAGVVAAKPTLVYYSFLNVVKAYVLTIGQRDGLHSNARHGLSEKYRIPPPSLANAYLCAYPSTSTKASMFDELLAAIRSSQLPSQTEYDLGTLLPQVVTGHRLWTNAAGEAERFISLEGIEFRHSRSSKKTWLELRVYNEDLQRVDLGVSAFLKRTGLSAEWRHVKRKQPAGAGKQLRFFEQKTPLGYADRPTDKAPDLVTKSRHSLWSVVRSQPEYRRYYAYVTPTEDRADVLPQLASIYAVSYYLGSVTRYRPSVFDDISDSEFGPLVNAFLDDAPMQFIYLMASEFAQQDVTRAAIVS